jgi:hypothetical protein
MNRFNEVCSGLYLLLPPPSPSPAMEITSSGTLKLRLDPPLSGRSRMGEGPLEFAGETLPPGDSFSFILLTSASNCLAASLALVRSFTGFLARASRASCCCSSSDCTGDELLRGAGSGSRKSLPSPRKQQSV